MEMNVYFVVNLKIPSRRDSEEKRVVVVAFVGSPSLCLMMSLA